MSKKTSKKSLKKRAVKNKKSTALTQTPDPLSTKMSLIAAAQKLFAQQDYEGVSVREIAKKAKVNIALISYHFKSKEGLYKECLKTFGLSRLSTAQEILTPPSTKEEFKIRLEIFCRNMMSSYTTDMDSAKILLREMQMDRDEFRPVIEEYIEPIFFLCVNFFNEAIKRKVVSKKLDPLFCTYTVFSCLCHGANCEKPMKRNIGLSIQDTKVQNSIVQHIVHIMTEGVHS